MPCRFVVCSLLLVGVAAMLGGINRFFVMPPWLAPESSGNAAPEVLPMRFKRILWIEALVLLAVVVLAAAAGVVLEVTVVLDPGLVHVAEAHNHADLDPGPDHGAGQDPGLDLVPGQGPFPGRGPVVGAALDREVSAEVAPDHGPVLGPEVAAGVVPGPRLK